MLQKNWRTPQTLAAAEAMRRQTQRSLELQLMATQESHAIRSIHSTLASPQPVRGGL